MNVDWYEHMVIKKYGGWVSPDDLLNYRKLKLGYDITTAEELLGSMSFGKLTRYFSKQMQITGKSGKFLMIQYRDYISMAKKLKIDLSRKTVRYPSNICKAHDAVLDDFNKLQFEKDNKAFVKAVKPIYARLPVKEFENEQYCIVFPKLRSDLVTEGKSLQHCVAGDDYCNNHKKGTQMIFFLRRVENRDKPFFTMEVDMKSGRIVQIHGFKNCLAPADVRKFADNFVRALVPGVQKEKGRRTA